MPSSTLPFRPKFTVVSHVRLFPFTLYYSLCQSTTLQAANISGRDFEMEVVQYIGQTTKTTLTSLNFPAVQRWQKNWPAPKDGSTCVVTAELLKVVRSTVHPQLRFTILDISFVSQSASRPMATPKPGMLFIPIGVQLLIRVYPADRLRKGWVWGNGPADASTSSASPSSSRSPEKTMTKSSTPSDAEKRAREEDSETLYGSPSEEGNVSAANIKPPNKKGKSVARGH